MVVVGEGLASGWCQASQGRGSDRARGVATSPGGREVIRGRMGCSLFPISPLVTSHRRPFTVEKRGVGLELPPGGHCPPTRMSVRHTPRALNGKRALGLLFTIVMPSIVVLTGHESFQKSANNGGRSVTLILGRTYGFVGGGGGEQL